MSLRYGSDRKRETAAGSALQEPAAVRSAGEPAVIHTTAEEAVLLVKTEKRQSSIHGLGLFAAQDIPAGTPTWEFTPGIDQAIHPQMLERFPPHARPWFMTYAYLDIKSGLYVLCADDARYMNHAEEPNVAGDYDKEPVFGLDVAARDIEAGEELTCDYRTFDRIDREKLHFRD